ncbi:glycosyltransferase family 4 protein [candidate division WOR-3 bacterium]|nr:glycosyltransferase family 4 protein [candidate division WOR-3 bacterium]
MQKIKIAMIDRDFPHYRNSLVKALYNTGIDITVIAPYNSEDSNLFKKRKWLKPIGLTRGFFKIKPFRILHKPFIISSNILVRDRFIKSLKPSIIHMQGVSFPLFEFFLQRKFDIPKIVTVHNVVPHDESFYNYRGILRRVYQRKGFNAFIVHSEMCKKILYSYCPSITHRIFIIPFGCNKVKIIPKNEARTKLSLPLDVYPLILFFGYIRKYKGLMYLIKSLSYVYKEFPDVKLVIAGREMYDNFSRYKKLINEEGLTKRVIIRNGYIPEDDAGLYFQSADLMALPYTNFTSQSGVLMRAYSNQTPVVVTDTGAMGEIVRKDATGTVVSPNSVKDLTDGILRILSDKKMQENAKRNMQLLVRTKYNWQKIAEDTIALYKKLL